MIIDINHITHVKHLGRLSGTNLGKYLHSERLIFGRRNKSVEGSRNMKFTHNVDWDIIKKILDEGNLIYFIIAIKKH